MAEKTSGSRMRSGAAFNMAVGRIAEGRRRIAETGETQSRSGRI
jgi:hypothetical protein